MKPLTTAGREELLLQKQQLLAARCGERLHDVPRGASGVECNPVVVDLAQRTGQHEARRMRKQQQRQHALHTTPHFRRHGTGQEELRTTSEALGIYTHERCTAAGVRGLLAVVRGRSVVCF